MLSSWHCADVQFVAQSRIVNLTNSGHPFLIREAISDFVQQIVHSARIRSRDPPWRFFTRRDVYRLAKRSHPLSLPRVFFRCDAGEILKLAKFVRYDQVGYVHILGVKFLHPVNHVDDLLERVHSLLSDGLDGITVLAQLLS